MSPAQGEVEGAWLSCAVAQTVCETRCPTLTVIGYPRTLGDPLF